MAEIVISEFMDEAAVADLRASFDVLYDKTLVDRPEQLGAARSSSAIGRRCVARCWKAHICA